MQPTSSSSSKKKGKKKNTKSKVFAWKFPAPLKKVRQPTDDMSFYKVTVLDDGTELHFLVADLYRNWLIVEEGARQILFFPHYCVTSCDTPSTILSEIKHANQDKKKKRLRMYGGSTLLAFCAFLHAWEPSANRLPLVVNVEGLRKEMGMRDMEREAASKHEAERKRENRQTASEHAKEEEEYVATDSLAQQCPLKKDIFNMNEHELYLLGERIRQSEEHTKRQLEKKEEDEKGKKRQKIETNKEREESNLCAHRDVEYVWIGDEGDEKEGEGAC